VIDYPGDGVLNAELTHEIPKIAKQALYVLCKKKFSQLGARLKFRLMLV
jgi:hypothetical protein